MQTVADLNNVKTKVRTTSRDVIQVLKFDADNLFTESEFLDLIPASTYFH